MGAGMRRWGGLRAGVMLAAMALTACQQGGAKTEPAAASGAVVLPGSTAAIAARRSQPIRDLIVLTARDALVGQPMPCANARPVMGDRYTPFGPATADPTTRQVNVSWIERVELQGCPGTVYANVMVTMRGASVGASLLDRGDGRADVPLSVSTLLRLKPLVAAAFDCRVEATTFTRTKFEGFTGPAMPTLPGRDGRPWREVWSFEGCGKVGDMTVQFTPDTRGTSFANTSQVRVHPL